MPLSDLVPLDRPGDLSRRIRQLEQDLRQLNARLTAADLPLTAVFTGTPLSGAYDSTLPVAQSTTRITASTDASGLLKVPLGDTMRAVLAAHPSELMSASGTAFKLFVRADLAAADVVVLQARSLVDGSVLASAAVDALVNVTYQA